jgi:hypothetical protein
MIIGIIASIVIPDLIADTQQAEYKTAWKKAYADLSQATLKIITDNGGTMKGLNVNYIYKSYLNYTKSCDLGYGDGVCWHNNGVVKILNGQSVSNYYGTSLALNNGMLMFFMTNGPTTTNCASAGWLTPLTICGAIKVDVNGFKGPNKHGVDIFSIWVQENKIIPMGIQGDGKENTCSTSSTGESCSALYLYQ